MQRPPTNPPITPPTTACDIVLHALKFKGPSYYDIPVPEEETFIPFLRYCLTKTKG